MIMALRGNGGGEPKEAVQMGLTRGGTFMKERPVTPQPKQRSPEHDDDKQVEQEASEATLVRIIPGKPDGEVDTRS